MIFLKPTIIRDDISADGLAQRKYNYLRADQLYNQVFIFVKFQAYFNTKAFEKERKKFDCRFNQR